MGFSFAIECDLLTLQLGPYHLENVEMGHERIDQFYWELLSIVVMGFALLFF